MSSKLGSGSGSRDAPAAQIAPPSPGVSKLVKLSLLIVLCLQNAVYTMLRRYRCVCVRERKRGKNEKFEQANLEPSPLLMILLYILRLAWFYFVWTYLVYL